MNQKIARQSPMTAILRFRASRLWRVVGETVGCFRARCCHGRMGFWNRNETEVHLSIAADEPARIGVYTNWPYYLTRFERCQGFTLTEHSEPVEGGRMISGTLDVSEFPYLWLRKAFGSERAERAYWRLRADLPTTPESVDSNYKVGVHERETLFIGVASEPYWLRVETDAAIWLRRLDKHPFAVCLHETVYAAEGSQPRACNRVYLLPRSLMTIRAHRPQYTEEHREELRARLASFAPTV